MEGIGIMDGGRSSMSIRKTNQLAEEGAVAAGEDANVAVLEKGILDIVDEVGEKFGNKAVENDKENDNEANTNNSNNDDEDEDEDDDEEEEEKNEEDKDGTEVGVAYSTPCVRGGRSRNIGIDNSDNNEKNTIRMMMMMVVSILEVYAKHKRKTISIMV